MRTASRSTNGPNVRNRQLARDLPDERARVHGEILRRFLDQPEFAALFATWARPETYRQVREQAEGAQIVRTINVEMHATSKETARVKVGMGPGAKRRFRA